MLITEASINRVVDRFAGTLYASIQKANPTVAHLIMEEMRLLEPADLSERDAQVEESNAKLRLRALYICAGAFGVALIGSIVQHLVYRKLLRGGDPDTAQHLMYAALIGGLCSFLSEFNFMVTVAAPSRPISGNEVARKALRVIKQSTRPPTKGDETRR